MSCYTARSRIVSPYGGLYGSKTYSALPFRMEMRKNNIDREISGNEGGFATLGRQIIRQRDIILAPMTNSVAIDMLAPAPGEL